MKERPVLFSGAMVRAILDGRKTQTRRIVKQAEFSPGEWANAIHPARVSGWIAWHRGVIPDLPEFTKRQYERGFSCPYGQPGDRLWVRETWCLRPEGYGYRADNDPDNTPRKWGPSIFMPRAASRIMLEVVNVRVERVQDISDYDAGAEGVCDFAANHAECPHSILHRDMFRQLWNEINGKRGYGWDLNPWVWVVEFRLI